MLVIPPRPGAAATPVKLLISEASTVYRMEMGMVFPSVISEPLSV
jgi:hypothetical protein